MRYHVCFDILHSNRLRLLVKVRDVGQPPFLEDIKELHNAFSIRSPPQGPRSEIDDAKSWDYRGHLYLLLWHIHTGAYPLPLHDDVSSYMYAFSPSRLKRFSIDVWDILHIHLGLFIQQSGFGAWPRSNSSIFIDLAWVYTRAYPMHFHVPIFKQMMVFEVAFS